jgi:hypothetical protein
MFYKRHLKDFRPRLLTFNIMIVQTQFALVLIVEGGIVQLLDPFSLQAFQAF